MPSDLDRRGLIGVGTKLEPAISKSNKILEINVLQKCPKLFSRQNPIGANICFKSPRSTEGEGDCRQYHYHLTKVQTFD